MMSASHWMPFWHEVRSQSSRPFSTSSTNWYWSFGSHWRNASFSSDEFTVIVQMVFFSACAAGIQSAASNAPATKILEEERIESIVLGPQPEFSQRPRHVPTHQPDFRRRP